MATTDMAIETHAAGRRQKAVIEFAEQATYYVAFFVISGMTIGT